MLKSPQMEGSFRLEVGQLLRYMLSAQLPFNIIIIIIFLGFCVFGFGEQILVVMK
ncbi:hypothetical protein HanPSC8_Chr13g0587891 [Helianthus annuus]|nr:hypothetical protein HanPSC8_Chr13g0587891 [Helianthus annuus]